MKKIFIGLIALLVSITLFAGQRTAEEAAVIAAQFTNQQPQLRRLHQAPRAATNMRLAHTALQENSADAAFYVFNQENENGFVIVSADDRTA
ncbi:MAG: Spi family protease inhibitor, partial [Paludibacteraceae bacterium]|nr:Spi family protease inhibitor [Paludibacteraceae bacterium]